MMKFECKDLGLDCNFMATGGSKEEVIKKAMEHGNKYHADLMRNMTIEQMAQFGKQLDASVKAV